MAKGYTRRSKHEFPLGEEGEPNRSDVQEPEYNPEADIAEVSGLTKNEPQNEHEQPIKVAPPEQFMQNQQHQSMQNVTDEYEPLGGSNQSTISLITKVDSPIDIKQVFWSFVTKDISMSNITQDDFGFILTNLKLRLYSFIQKYPIEEWDNIKFAEYEQKIEPLIRDGKVVVNEQGQIAYIQNKIVKNSWDFSELLIDLEEYVYHQLTRGRQGFTFRRITESFSVTETGGGSNEPTPAKSGWKLW